MPRFFFVLIVFLFVLMHAPVCAFEVEPDQLGPGEFYFQQYVHEPWREAESLKQLGRKSVELLAATVIVSGFLSIKKRRT